jgi:hypothetical protein
VPFVRLDDPTEVAFTYARTLSTDVRAIHLARSEKESADMAASWGAHWPGQAGSAPKLISRRRGMGPLGGAARPIARALRELERQLPAPDPKTPGMLTTIVIPEWHPGHLLEGVLGRSQVSYLKLVLLRRPETVVASIPAPGAGGITTATAAEPTRAPSEKETLRVALVPVLAVDAPGMRALDYAAHVADRIIAVHVEAPGSRSDDNRDRVQDELVAWRQRHLEDPARMRIVVIESPTRLVVEPLVAYVDTWRRAHPEPICTVVLPELIDGPWWAAPLHNHRALWLRAALLDREHVAVASIPFQLRREVGPRG